MAAKTTNAVATPSANIALNYLLQNAAATGSGSANRYVALLTAAANIAAGSITEVSGGSYARQICAWNTASGGTSTNSSSLTYTNLPGVTIVNFAVFDSLTGGVLIYVGTTTSQAIAAGNGMTIAAGALTVSES